MALGPEPPRSVHSSDGGVVLDVDRGRIFSLNPSGSAIFRLLEQGFTDDDIVRELVERFEISPVVARSDLAEFCHALEHYALFPGPRSSGQE
jgi:hypothetical protein